MLSATMLLRSAANRRQIVIGYFAILLLLAVLMWIVLGTAPAKTTDSALLKALFVDPKGKACQKQCMFGVEVGKTKFKDAVEMLKSHPYMQGNFTLGDAYSGSNLKSQTFRGKGDRFWLLVQEDERGNVCNLQLGPILPYPAVLRAVPNPEMPILEQAISFLGTPTSITFYKSYAGYSADSEIFYMVHLDYPEKGLVLDLIYRPDSAIRPQDRILGIYTACTIAFYSDLGHGGRWQGFKSIGEYLNSGAFVVDLAS